MLVENQLKPANLSIPGDGLEGLSHPTYLQAGVCVLQPRQIAIYSPLKNFHRMI